MIKVAGTYMKYPPMKSDSAEPMPAAREPYIGPRSRPDNNTKPSPGWMYPFVGVGTFIIIVPTQVIAAISAASMIFFVLYVFIELFICNPCLVASFR